MSSGNITFFSNDSGAANTSLTYIQDNFDDVSLPPTNNTGFSSSIGNNPFSLAWANDDSMRYGAKTLWIKDLVLVDDRTQWVSNKPTYKIVWNESFPQISGYIFGLVEFDDKLDQPVILFPASGDGIGVTGVFKRVAFIVGDSTSATATATYTVDGVSGNTIDFSSLSATSSSTRKTRFSAFNHSTTNENYNIHDIQLKGNQTGTLRVVGVVVYFSNAGNNIDVFPGNTYVNKSKITTSSGATFALPTYGSPIGGNITVYKTSSSGYASSAVSVTTMVTTATGTAGTNLLTVGTGHGSSFPIGSGFFIPGTTNFGCVQSISTDTLTVYPNLNTTVSGQTMYRTWLAGISTNNVNASLMVLYKSVEFGNYLGFTETILDPNGKFGIYTFAIGVSAINNTRNSAYFKSAVTACFFRIEGYFSAVEIEVAGGNRFSASISINGLPCSNIDVASGSGNPEYSKVLATDMGMQWNLINISPTSNMGDVGIRRINLYRRQRDLGVSYGMLGELNTNNQFFDIGSLTRDGCAFGTMRRVYSDQMFFSGTWTREGNTTSPGNVRYNTSGAGNIFKADYYGKNFAVLGVLTGGTLLIDGAGTPLNANKMVSVATEMMHSIVYTSTSGSTSIDGLDFSSSSGEVYSLQKFFPRKEIKTVSETKLLTSPKPRNQIRLNTSNGFGSPAGNIPRYIKVDEYVGNAMTYTDSSAGGTVIQINEDGIYSISCTAGASTANNDAAAGISLNSDQTGTDVWSIRARDRLAISTYNGTLQAGGGNIGSATVYTASWTGFLKNGDVIRPHTGTDEGATPALASLQISKIG